MRRLIIVTVALALGATGAGTPRPLTGAGTTFAPYSLQGADKSPQVPGAGHGFLIDKHLKAKVSCKSCHAANPPGKQTNWITTCLGCHEGSYNKLAEKTVKVYPNPHVFHDYPFASSEGPLACELCHHVHKASEVYCYKCHNASEFSISSKPLRTD